VLDTEKAILKEVLQRIASQNTYDPTQRIGQLEKHLLSYFAPEDFNFFSPGSFEHSHERSFSETCLLLQGHAGGPVEKMSVFKFFSLAEFVKRKKPKTREPHRF